MRQEVTFITVVMVLTEAAVSPPADTEEQHYSKCLNREGLFKCLLLCFKAEATSRTSVNAECMEAQTRRNTKI